MYLDAASKNTVIEAFFETKFETTYIKEEIARNCTEEEFLGVPETVLSNPTANDLMKPVTLSELNRNIDNLDSSKAEGLDGVTNGMLKNTGPVACKLLLEMFNNVMSGSQVPSDWKLGDVVLILKKPLNTNINNYRPITLISCISKLLTRLLAKRLSEVIETEDIVGLEQNGFRSSRSCSDNLFILHTAHEINKSRKILSHLLFVDLKEAYDRVDRDILLAKLRQLNFPTTFVNFLNNYYFQDSISTASGGPGRNNSIRNEAYVKAVI